VLLAGPFPPKERDAQPATSRKRTGMRIRPDSKRQVAFRFVILESAFIVKAPESAEDNPYRNFTIVNWLLVLVQINKILLQAANEKKLEEDKGRIFAIILRRIEWLSVR
jgi:hypothetical protein